MNTVIHSTLVDIMCNADNMNIIIIIINTSLAIHIGIIASIATSLR